DWYDKPYTVYLDAWHRVRLSWWVPGGTGLSSMELGDESWRGFFDERSRPALFENPDPNAHEYYLFEYRGRRSYDQSVNDIGIVVWHVREDGNGNPFQGPQNTLPEGDAIYAFSSDPSNAVGGSHAWHPSDGIFQLRWDDGSLLPLAFWVEDLPRSTNSQLLRWKTIPPDHQPPTVRIIRPADNAQGTFGFANVVAFEAQAIASNGNQSALTIDWRSDLDGALGSGALVYKGFLTPGKRKITVTVRDEFGATASASVTYQALNAPPSVTIVS